MLKRFFNSFLVLLTFLTLIHVRVPEVLAVENVAHKLLPGAVKIGEGHYSYLGWSIYDATLYGHSRPVGYDKPFALTLHYHLSAKGQDIAKRSIEGIRQQGFRDEFRLATWYRQMRRIFPDVQKGTRITGVYLPRAGVRFFHGNKEIGSIQDRQFSTLFFNIWLSETTSLKALRQKLLGMR
jgi:hypothetical protein